MIIDNTTGEVVLDKFAMLFFDDIEKLFSLTSLQSNILMLMVKHTKMGNGNRISMTPKRKKEFVDKLGISGTVSLSNALRTMEVADVIKREEDGSTTFMINPSIFFKGNDYQHVQVVIKYSNGTRDIKVSTYKGE